MTHRPASVTPAGGSDRGQASPPCVIGAHQAGRRTTCSISSRETPCRCAWSMFHSSQSNGSSMIGSGLLIHYLPRHTDHPVVVIRTGLGGVASDRPVAGQRCTLWICLVTQIAEITSPVAPRSSFEVSVSDIRVPDHETTCPAARCRACRAMVSCRSVSARSASRLSASTVRSAPAWNPRAQKGSSRLAHSQPFAVDGRPADADCVMALRTTGQALVALDIAYGENEIFPLAVRIF